MKSSHPKQQPQTNPGSKKGTTGPVRSCSSCNIETKSCKDVPSVSKSDTHRKCSSAGTVRNNPQSTASSTLSNHGKSTSASAVTSLLSNLKIDRPSARLNPKTIDPVSFASLQLE